ncbi:N-acyl homoserine lactonase family protein [Roseobacter weihaiensis]|uniref:N-acyl homoserine lactonase family protein n=1 Tax=Roseobacter weihaiensis TaxID=2763262 RepID=UPI001D0B129E|nr:N-acyl homoserine lactonase family protein [Roseobacter sp. H9]
MRLYLLSFGTMQPGDIPVAGYLVQTDNGTNVLVDTGWPRSYVENPQHPPGLTLEIAPEDTVVARLASIGLTPSDIDILVCSHLDDDHSGNHDLFPGAELVVQREHYELAKGGHPRFATNREIWDLPDLNYRLIEGDTALTAGVELLETGGHVPGHQSVLVRLPKTGPVLLAVDAVMDQSMADADTREMWVTDWSESPDDEARIRASTQKIAEVAARERAALVVYGHDARQWAELRRAPEYYE